MNVSIGFAVITAFFSKYQLKSAFVGESWNSCFTKTTHATKIWGTIWEKKWYEKTKADWSNKDTMLDVFATNIVKLFVSQINDIFCCSQLLKMVLLQLVVRRCYKVVLKMPCMVKTHAGAPRWWRDCWGRIWLTRALLIRLGYLQNQRLIISIITCDWMGYVKQRDLMRNPFQR